jgi:hypothetical protein
VQEKTMPNHPSTQDPDGFCPDDAIRPDPVFMALRRTWEVGPVARLIAWFQRDRRVEAMVSRIRPAPISAEAMKAIDAEGHDLAA